MFKRSDILPLILAFVSTVLIVTFGFTWLAQSSITGFGKNDLRRKSNVEPDANPSSGARVNGKFMLPVLVPQGTSVAIDGSAKLQKINQILRRSFHQQYPGTIIVTDADGTEAALARLYSGDIDLVALDRTLNNSEKAAGLKAIPIRVLDRPSPTKIAEMYYVYKEPISPDTEAFLGFALSGGAQNATVEP